MQGLIPTEWGAKALPEFVYPITGTPTQSVAHPFPQMVQVAGQLMLWFQTALYKINEDDWTDTNVATATYNPGTPGSTLAISAGGELWQFAGFQQGTYFATNGQSLIYEMPSNDILSGTTRKAYNAETTVLCRAIANHQDRLVLGGLSGTHFSTTPGSDWDNLWEAWRENAPENIVVSDDETIGLNYILYSEQSGGDADIPFATIMAALGQPDSATYDKLLPIILGYIEQGKMGLYPIRTSETIHAMKEHNGDLIVYGDKSVSRLSMGEVIINGRVAAGYREQVLLDQGIAGRGCVGGDDSTHVFVTNHGELYRLRAGEGLERLGYSEFIFPLVDTSAEAAKTLIAFDPSERFYWITNGVNGFCLTRTGLGGCDDIMPISVLRNPKYPSALIGTGTVAGSPGGATIETEIFDGEKRSAWEIAYVDISTTDTDATGWQLAPRYRLNKADALVTKAAETFDQRGRVRTKTPGIDHALLLTAADRTKVDLERIFVLEGQGKLSLRDLHNTV